MNMLWLKLLSLLVIFLIGTLAGLFPMKKNLSAKGKQNLILGNAFAGGVFLGAGLLHMLADGIENFNSLYPKVDFPFPMLIAGAGFILILILDRSLSGEYQSQASAQKSGSATPLILFIVLSIHSIIAGASLGLEGAAISVLAIFFAIIAHKGAAGFSLGISLKQADFPRKRHIGTILLFAAMTPLGVLLGTLFTEFMSSDMSAMFEMIFDCLAAGTFLYIAITEIIAKIFNDAKHTWPKLIFISSGFALMAVVAIWT